MIMPLSQTHASLDEWLSWLEQQHPKAMDLGLLRISEIAAKLNLLHPTPLAITVAGTNGKGSTIALIEKICLAAQLRVGTYTSPHITNYRERIKINGQMVSEKRLCEHFAQVTQFNEDMTLTYFEYGTLAALSIFKEEPLDILLLEVGLGGRLDAVNMIDPNIAIITHIDIDHTEWLGNTREAIGKEKAGIFRSNQKAICGDSQPPKIIKEIAKDLGTQLSFMGVHFSYTEYEESWDWCGETVHYKNLPKPSLRLDNAAIALQGISYLSEYFSISQEAICQGLVGANLLGRQQFVDSRPMKLFDVAHNSQACHALAERIQALEVLGRVICIMGMLEDKDSTASLKPFESIVDEWFFPDLRVSRAASPHKVVKNLPKKIRDRSIIVDSVAIAWKTALEQANDGDLIVVFGSFHTVSQIFAILGPQEA